MIGGVVSPSTHAVICSRNLFSGHEMSCRGGTPMVSPNSIIVIEDSTFICLGTDPQSLAEVGMMGWQKGYELACHNAPQFLTFADQQEIAEQMCRDNFWQLAPLDTNTLKGAYH